MELTMTFEDLIKDWHPNYKTPKSMEHLARRFKMLGRRFKQRNMKPSIVKQPSGKYIPAGRLKNV